MGRKRKPEEEKSTTIFLRLPNPLLWKIEKDGDVQKVILSILEYHYRENK